MLYSFGQQVIWWKLHCQLYPQPEGTMPTGVNGHCVMRSPITESGRSGDTTKIKALSREPGNPRWTDDPCIFSNFMGNIDQNQFQPTNNQPRADHVAINQAVPNGEARTRHHLSTYTDYEKRWLAITANEERSKGTRFMIRLKRRQDEQYPEKNHISKQNLRDNAVRFKKKLFMNDNRDDPQMEIDQDNILNNVSKWTNKMKVNLLNIEKRERNQGRGFMK